MTFFEYRQLLYGLLSSDTRLFRHFHRIHADEGSDDDG